MVRFLLVFVLFVLVSVNAIGKAKPFRYVSETFHKKLLTFIPKTDHAWIEEIRKKRYFIFYTEDYLPSAFQHESPFTTPAKRYGLMSSSYNLAGNGDRIGHANGEFPWANGFGLDRSSQTVTLKFVSFPLNEDGTPLKPITWWWKKIWADFVDLNRWTYVWSYPVGTIFGEVVATRPKNSERYYTTEVRMRRKVNNAKKVSWRGDIIRPFPTPKALASQVKLLFPNWKEHSDLEELVKHCENQDIGKVMRLRDFFADQVFSNNTLANEFLDVEAVVDYLPLISSEKVILLLNSTKFVSVLGQAWRTKEGSQTNNVILGHAPSTKAGFHVVPNHYAGTFFPVETATCQKCHSSPGKHARAFHNRRKWYGRVRGSFVDGVFSHYPFTKSSISYNGSHTKVEFDSRLIKAGLFREKNE